MRYSLATFIACMGLFFIFSSAAFRYQAFLSLNRFVRGGQVLNYETLRAENNALKAALLATQPKGIVSQNDGKLVFANVFAEYPFNGHSLVRVDKGASDGMRVGYPATFGGSVLAGQVSAVYARQSVVRMIGSPDWQIPVHIGPHKVAGLLIGGLVPRVSMIAAHKKIVVGDEIIAASSDLPYGLLIGTVSSLVNGSTGGIFQEVIVKFSYDSQDIAELAFMVWIPK